MKKKNKERQQTTSCGAITWRIHEGALELLLIKQFEHKETWGIPKGHINKEETLQECALREVFEETGIRVELAERLPDCHAHMKKECKRVVAFLATSQDPSAQPSSVGPESEVADVKWIAVDRLPPIVAYQQSLVAAAVEILKARLNGPTN